MNQSKLQVVKQEMARVNINILGVSELKWTEMGNLTQMTIKKKCNKAKWLSEEALQIAVKRREVKGKGEKERYTHLNSEFQR